MAAIGARKFTLYWNPMCPFVHRVLITMQEKGIVDDRAHGIERVFISLSEDAPEWYKQINPKETVPTLVVEGVKTPVFESALVAEYFDRNFGVPNALLPNQPNIRVLIRNFQAVAGDLIGALYGAMFAKGDDKSSAQKRAKEAVDAVESALKHRPEPFNNGPYFLGPQFSLADVHIAPFLQRFSATLPAIAKFDAFKSAPLLNAYANALNARPSIANTGLTAGQYIEMYAKYSGQDEKDLAIPRMRVDLNPVSSFQQRITVGAALVGKLELLDIHNHNDKFGNEYPEVAYHDASVKGSSANGLLLLTETVAPALFDVKTLRSEDVSRAQFIAGEADELASAFYPWMKEPTDEIKKRNFTDALSAVEVLIEGPWAVGATPTIADAVLIPHLARIRTHGQLTLSNAPKLNALIDRALTLPEVMKALDAGEACAVEAKGFQAFVKHQ